jgi:hypothetical protein
MALAVVHSVNGVPVRLTDERWQHIVDDHPYMTSYYEAMLDAVESPAYILRGRGGTLAAVVHVGRRNYLHVFYRETGRRDGFIITAFVQRGFDRNRVVWREEDQ